MTTLCTLSLVRRVGIEWDFFCSSCVADCASSDKAPVHEPLIFLESFNAPALVLDIGGYKIRMPVDWQILIGEPDLGDLEMLPLTSINDRGFKAFQFNPLSSFRPSFPDVEILDVYHDVMWYAPKLKNGQLLAVPISDGEKPECVYFAKDVSRNCEIVDYNKAW